MENQILASIGAGLGAMYLRNKLRTLSEGKETGTPILNFGKSELAQSSKPMKTGSGKDHDPMTNASTTDINSKKDDTGFAKKESNMFSKKETPTSASQLKSIPKMSPSN